MTPNTTPSHHPSRRGPIAIALVSALALAACSQSAADDPAADDTAAESTPGATTEPPAAEPADEPAGDEPAAPEPTADEPGDSAAPPPVGDGVPGVTDGTITLSFIITDTSKVAAAFGWEAPEEGDRVAQTEALVAAVNRRGGIAGRLVDARIRVFDAITDGPVAEEQLCNAITQDDQAFAVVMTGQFQENARPCYAAADTLMFDATLYPVDNAGYEALAPYLWSPLLPSYDDLVGGMAGALVETGWFDGATVGVIAIDSELNERVYTDQFLPVLADAGVEVASYNTIDPTDGTSLNNDQLQAIINFKEAGVDKVVAIGGTRLLSFFIDTSTAQNFSPVFAMTSYDNPEFNVVNYPEYLPGTRGISVMPGFDIGDDQYPFPATDAERECLAELSDAGFEYDGRASVRTVLMFCDVLRLLEAADDDLDEVSALGVTEALWRLGEHEPASVYAMSFTEGSYAGGAGYTVIEFDESCGCMAATETGLQFGG